jgi:hypothetical protein
LTGVTKLKRLVEQNRPAKFGLANICIHQKTTLKRDYDNLHTECFQFSFALSQLRQMFTARQSAKMPVENQQ